MEFSILNEFSMFTYKIIILTHVVCVCVCVCVKLHFSVMHCGIEYPAHTANYCNCCWSYSEYEPILSSPWAIHSYAPFPATIPQGMFLSCEQSSVSLWVWVIGLVGHSWPLTGMVWSDEMDLAILRLKMAKLSKFLCRNSIVEMNSKTL